MFCDSPPPPPESVRTDGRTDVRSRDYQIFSAWWFTKFSYPWCSAGALRALSSAITKKLRQRADLGWDKVNDAIAKAPFCEHNEQIVKVLFCYKCRDCLRNGLCNMCSKNGVKHFLGYPVYDEDDYDEIFKKSYNTNWCGAVA